MALDPSSVGRPSPLAAGEAVKLQRRPGFPGEGARCLRLWVLFHSGGLELALEAPGRNSDPPRFLSARDHKMPWFAKLFVNDEGESKTRPITKADDKNDHNDNIDNEKGDEDSAHGNNKYKNMITIKIP